VDRECLLLYNLSTKAHDEFRDGASMRRMVKMPKIKVKGKETYVTPFQWHFISSRTTLDREHTMYEDERGIVRYGLVVYIGHVLHPPPSTIMDKTQESLGQILPYMDNLHAMRNEPFEIILNPDSGLRSN
jgi:hypothetical protein